MNISQIRIIWTLPFKNTKWTPECLLVYPQKFLKAPVTGGKPVIVLMKQAEYRQPVTRWSQRAESDTLPA